MTPAADLILPIRRQMEKDRIVARDFLRGREGEVLAAMRRSVEERGRMPTEKELCHEIGMWRGSLTRITASLVRKGYLHLPPRGTMRHQFIEI